MPVIRKLAGLEILDSRGRPTVQAFCELDGGAAGGASVPSGASTGAAEAREKRDGDPRRYRGLGCRQAAALVSEEIHAALQGRAFGTQEDLDRALITLDGSPDKSRLGANAALAVSLAFARAAAAERRLPLHSYFAEIAGQPPGTLPRPAINLFSGGKHAGGQVPIQDVLIVPAAARTIDEVLSTAWEIYQCAAELCLDRYGMRALAADEGGLAPPFPDAAAMLADAVASIRRAGFIPGRDVYLAIDAASSHFHRGGLYHLDREPLDGGGLIARYESWMESHPIGSIEDGLAEDDWAGWPELSRRIGSRAWVIGDDFLCTNPARIRRAIQAGAANALLLKVNQIGTLTEAAEALRLARGAGWHVTISARSGETEDSWLADLAAGWGADQIKIGSITRSERLAKYNRLLAIEAETRLPVNARLPAG